MNNRVIREKRRLSFSNKRISIEIVRSLSNLIQKEAAQLIRSGADYYLMFSVDASKNTAYESQSGMLFDSPEILEKKVIEKINMTFYSLDYSKNIQVQIVHTKERESENYVAVSGDDATWVNGILSRLSQILQEAEQQASFYGKFGGWLVFAVLLLFNFEYYHLFYREDASFDSLIIGLAYIFLFPLISTVLAFKLHNWLTDMWPVVEIQTGPVYMQEAVRKRTTFNWLMTAIFLPLLLSILYDIFKDSF